MNLLTKLTKSIALKLMIVIIPIMLLSLAIITVNNHLRMKQLYEDNEISQNEFKLRYIKARVSESLRLNNALTTQMKNDIVIVNAIGARKFNFLDNLLFNWREQHNGIELIEIYDHKGHLKSSSSPALKKNLVNQKFDSKWDQPWFQSAINGTSSNTPIRFSTFFNKRIINYYSPILSVNNKKFVLRIVYDTSKIFKDLSSVIDTESLDDNQIIIHNDKNEIISHVNANKVYNNIALLDFTNDGLPWTGNYSKRHDILMKGKNSYRVSYEFINEHGIKLFVLITNKRKLFEVNYWPQIRENILLSLFIMALCMPIIFIMAKFILRPIQLSAKAISKQLYQSSMIDADEKTIDESINTLLSELDLSDRNLATTNIQSLRNKDIEEQQFIHVVRMAEIGELASSILHDISNSNFIIQGKVRNAIKRLQKDDEDVDREKLLELVNVIEKNNTKAGKIIKNVKSLARKSEDDDFIIYNLKNIIDDAIDLNETKIHSLKVSITRKSDFESHELECRPSQLAQVFMNLISNSCDAISTQTDRWISVEVTDIDQQLEIKVTDSGHGIPKEIQDKIMKPFFTTKDLKKGTGLGLSITKRIIEAHNGMISINNDSLNTQFIIVLPKKQKKLTEVA